MTDERRRTRDLDRRDVLKVGAAALGASFLPVAPAPADGPPQARAELGPAPVAPFADPPMEVVRVGFVGVGLQGASHCRNLLRIPGVRLTALCDIVPEKVDRVRQWVVDAGQPEPVVYTRGDRDVERLCETEDLDARPRAGGQLPGHQPRRSLRLPGVDERPVTRALRQFRQVGFRHPKTDRACPSWCPLHKTTALERENHVMDRRRSHLEESLKIRLGRSHAVDLREVVDECKVLPLLRCERPAVPLNHTCSPCRWRLISEPVFEFRQAVEDAVQDPTSRAVLAVVRFRGDAPRKIVDVVQRETHNQPRPEDRGTAQPRFDLRVEEGPFNDQVPFAGREPKRDSRSGSDVHGRRHVMVLVGSNARGSPAAANQLI